MNPDWSSVMSRIVSISCLMHFSARFNSSELTTVYDLVLTRTSCPASRLFGTASLTVGIYFIPLCICKKTFHLDKGKRAIRSMFFQMNIWDGVSISIRFKCTLFNHCCFFPIANLLTVSVAASSFIGMLCMHWCFSFSSLFFNLLLMGFVELYLYWILSMIFVFSFFVFVI